MLAVYCLLFVVRAARRSLLLAVIGCCLLVVVCLSLFVVCCPLCVVCCTLRVGCWLFIIAIVSVLCSVVQHVMYGVWCMLHVVCYV